MSLRLRLILAFFLLSVVPLGALTFYVYRNNAQAMRETAGRETELLAGELSQRMQVVTARLTEQVEHLVELAESNQAATEAARRAVADGDRDASADRRSHRGRRRRRGRNARTARDAPQQRGASRLSPRTWSRWRTRRRARSGRSGPTR